MTPLWKWLLANLQSNILPVLSSSCSEWGGEQSRAGLLGTHLKQHTMPQNIRIWRVVLQAVISFWSSSCFFVFSLFPVSAFCLGFQLLDSPCSNETWFLVFCQSFGVCWSFWVLHFFCFQLSLFCLNFCCEEVVYLWFIGLGCYSRRILQWQCLFLYSNCFPPVCYFSLNWTFFLWPKRMWFMLSALWHKKLCIVIRGIGLCSASSGTAILAGDGSKQRLRLLRPVCCSQASTFHLRFAPQGGNSRKECLGEHGASLSMKRSKCFNLMRWSRHPAYLMGSGRTVSLLCPCSIKWLCKLARFFLVLSQEPYKQEGRSWVTEYSDFLLSYCLSSTSWQWVYRLMLESEGLKMLLMLFRLLS